MNASTRTIVNIVRGLAFTAALIMLYYFITQNQKVFRPDNAFMVPDVSFAILLTVSALLPLRWAVPAMMFSFSFAAGVIGVSFFSYVARDGAFDVGNFLVLTGLLVSSLLLSLVVLKGMPSKKA